jgi:hypothetical protein
MRIVSLGKNLRVVTSMQTTEPARRRIGTARDWVPKVEAHGVGAVAHARRKAAGLEARAGAEKLRAGEDSEVRMSPMRALSYMLDEPMGILMIGSGASMGILSSTKIFSLEEKATKRGADRR